MKASIKLEGYTEPSPIQAASWPSTFKGKDVLAIAKTGSGKTCGYLLPGMCDILKKGTVINFERFLFAIYNFNLKRELLVKN